jgi:triosephosphate isomerase
MRTKIIAGNWKMNKDVTEGRDLARGLRERLDAGALSRSRVLLFPPFPSLPVVAEVLRGSDIGLGAQNMSEHDDGAYTGEVSWRMLLSVGCTHVILGHSERRQFFGESDAVINKKARKALGKGLIPIVCVGETLAERESGQMETVVSRQVRESLEGIPGEQATRIIIAYEPVWAIGTGRTATPEQAEEMHVHIRGLLAGLHGPQAAESIVIQYGGSVKPENAVALLSKPDIDGALVGGACLNVDSFLAIIRASEG